MLVPDTIQFSVYFFQSELTSKWSEEKFMLEQQKNLAEKKYHDLNEQVATALWSIPFGNLTFFHPYGISNTNMAPLVDYLFDVS